MLSIICWIVSSWPSHCDSKFSRYLFFFSSFRALLKFERKKRLCKKVSKVTERNLCFLELTAQNKFPQILNEVEQMLCTSATFSWHIRHIPYLKHFLTQGFFLSLPQIWAKFFIGMLQAVHKGFQYFRWGLFDFIPLVRAMPSLLLM